jgi:hypothetical protein
MRRINSGRVALAVSATALFVALGGTAVAVTQIGTNQIQNGAVTTPKLHDGAVTNSKLANNSVGNAKIKDNSITANKVKPNTYLPAGGTAVNSSLLGGLGPNNYIQGEGFSLRRRVVLTSGGTDLFGAGFGEFGATCNSNQPQATWTPSVSNAEYSAAITQLSSARLDTLNAIPAGVSEPEPASPGLPFSITYQIGYTAGGIDHVVTAVITGRFELGTGCVFTAQEVASL